MKELAGLLTLSLKLPPFYTSSAQGIAVDVANTCRAVRTANHPLGSFTGAWAEYLAVKAVPTATFGDVLAN